MSVLPVLLGDGTRLFDRTGGHRVRLEKVSVTQGAQARPTCGSVSAIREILRNLRAMSDATIGWLVILALAALGTIFVWWRIR